MDHGHRLGGISVGDFDSPQHLTQFIRLAVRGRCVTVCLLEPAAPPSPVPTSTATCWPPRYRMTVRFEFKEISRDDLRRASAGKFPDSLVDWCYAENSDKTVPVPHACRETRRSTYHS